MVMEGKKLEVKLRDWATDLSFKLPDGSAPPANYFSLLTATPHRRQLWEALVESVQPRKKVEHMRKQIMVAKLKTSKKSSRKHDSATVTDRIEAWHKQDVLENQIKGQRNQAVKLKRNLIAKASDVLFEICKLAELEKLYEESSEKALALRLFTKWEQNMMKGLEMIVLKVLGTASHSDYFEVSGSEKNLDLLKNELLGAGGCKSPFHDGHVCKLKNKLRELCGSGMTEQNAWEEVVKCKKNLLNKFALFLEELNSNEKNALSEKDVEIEKSLSASITQLKQKATEKSFQVILNSIEGQALDWEFEKLEEMLWEEPILKGSPSLTFNEAVFSHPSVGTSELLAQSEKEVMNVRKYVNIVELKGYKEFLNEELRRLEEEMTRAGSKEAWKEAGKELEPSIKAVVSVDSVVAEINSEWSMEDGLTEEILRNHEKLMRGLRSLRADGEEKNRARAVEDAYKLKFACGKLIDVFVETPLEAFRTVESCSGRLLFECESISHCFNAYGGELNQFFSALLIPPRPDFQSILSEVRMRQKMFAEVRDVTRRRDELAHLQRKIEHRINSMSLDTQLCKNFKEADGILWSVLFKSNELLRGTDFIERILKNWVEQPYRWMMGMM